ncbi:KAP family P-loop NTPase fold protein [Celeribacter sp.]|uniref:KAP family P-loop NTPase fold protein n=1 Tax=Celeribacter sp. TaxID=1890673 RepID=UPI003A90C67B
MSGQRLTVPEPEIELYQDGFEVKEGGVSDLGRASDGEKLSDLVEKIKEPMVIAVDAPWGAGKSVFLKCWVGEHIKEKHGNEATTVYFDAFKNDFMGDPLVSIFKEVSDRIESLKPKTANEAEQQRIAKLKALSNKAKKYAPILGRAALRLAVGTVATEAIMDIENPDESTLDEMLENAGSEAAKAIGSFWQAEETRTQAMDGFRTYLTDLAAEQKLAIVVDELDRCRPDYALNLLEVIKHFFNVPNVHFVLGVNLTELENSVRARYGAGVNAGLYLQKFVTVTMRLSNARITSAGSRSYVDYFGNVAEKLGLPSNFLRYQARAYLEHMGSNTDISLRNIEHFVRLLIISPWAIDLDYDWRTHQNLKETIRIGLLLMKAVAPELISKVSSGTIQFSEINHFFNLPDPRDATRSGEQISISWRICYFETMTMDFWHEYLQENIHILNEYGAQTPIQILKDYVEVFEWDA